MCLSTIKTKEEMQEWLKTQPDMITAYKYVKKTPKAITFIDVFRRGRIRYSLRPMHYEENFKNFKKKNRIKRDRPTVYPVTYHRCFADPPIKFNENDLKTSYKAYFHLWLDKPVHLEEEMDINFVTIKCSVPKYLITAIGTEEMVVKTTYVQTDDPKKMGTTKKEYEHIPVIVSKGFNIVSEC